MTNKTTLLTRYSCSNLNSDIVLGNPVYAGLNYIIQLFDSLNYTLPSVAKLNLLIIYQYFLLKQIYYHFVAFIVALTLSDIQRIGLQSTYEINLRGQFTQDNKFYLENIILQKVYIYISLREPFFRRVVIERGRRIRHFPST